MTEKFLQGSATLCRALVQLTNRTRSSAFALRPECYSRLSNSCLNNTRWWLHSTVRLGVEHSGRSGRASEPAKMAEAKVTRGKRASPTTVAAPKDREHEITERWSWRHYSHSWSHASDRSACASPSRPREPARRAADHELLVLHWSHFHRFAHNGWGTQVCASARVRPCFALRTQRCFGNGLDGL